MANFKDLTGQTFGRLYVEGIAKKVKSGKRERYYWKCKCECGNSKDVRTDGLTSGSIQSCGCLKKEQDRINLIRNHRHKLSGTKLWHTYYGMKDRCYKKEEARYSDYGGRGIRVCDEWLESFDNFAEWALANGVEKDLQIDRIDNNGNYEPSNCRWVTQKENCRNRRSNRMVEHEGKLITLVELSEMLNMPYRKAVKLFPGTRRSDL